MAFINSPLEQFQIFPVLQILIGNFDFSITNATVIILVRGRKISQKKRFQGNNNKSKKDFCELSSFQTIKKTLWQPKQGEVYYIYNSQLIHNMKEPKDILYIKYQTGPTPEKEEKSSTDLKGTLLEYLHDTYATARRQIFFLAMTESNYKAEGRSETPPISPFINAICKKSYFL